MTAIAPITSHTKNEATEELKAPTSSYVVSREWTHLTRICLTHVSIPGLSTPES